MANNITFEGVITHIGEARQGTSQKGNEWKVQSYTITEGEGQYPQSISFEVFGDKIAEMNIQPSQRLRVFLNFDTNEYNGRVYNRVRAWKVEALEATQTAVEETKVPTVEEYVKQQMASQAQPQQTSIFPEAQQTPSSADDNLPF